MTDLFTSDVILQRHNFTSQHMKQCHDVIFFEVILPIFEKVTYSIIYQFIDAPIKGMDNPTSP